MGGKITSGYSIVLISKKYMEKRLEGNILKYELLPCLGKWDFQICIITILL